MVINRVGPLSSAKVVGLLYAILGLALGAIISLISRRGRLRPRGAPRPRSSGSRRWSSSPSPTG